MLVIGSLWLVDDACERRTDSFAGDEKSRWRVGKIGRMMGHLERTGNVADGRHTTCPEAGLASQFAYVSQSSRPLWVRSAVENCPAIGGHPSPSPTCRQLSQRRMYVKQGARWVREGGGLYYHPLGAEKTPSSGQTPE